MGLTSLILIFDSIMWIFDGKSNMLFRIIILLSTILYFIINPIICMVWSLYVDYQINHDKTRNKKIAKVFSVLVMINTLFSILSIFNNYYFYYDSNNSYHKGVYYFVVTAICFAMIFYTFVYLLYKQKDIHQRFFLTILKFTLPPIIGAILQLIFHGLSFIWVGMTLSILIIFINIQNEQMCMDYLTGLFNRRQLDFYLAALIKKNKKSFAGIMIDLNNFKYINDHYGHSSGDEALRCTSKLLKTTFGTRAFVSRFGGDEFVVLLEINNRNDLDSILSLFKVNVEKFNDMKSLPYNINFSIGADLYSNAPELSVQEFFNYIDSLMYQDKKIHMQKRIISCKL